MRRTIFLLFSMMTIIIYLPRCCSVYGEMIPNKSESEAIDIKDGERVKVEANSKDLYLNKEESSELLGRWRNNGEALEPKWRDGDAVPSLPFSHYARTYSKEKDPDLISYESPYESSNYRRFDDQRNDYVESYQNSPSLPIAGNSKIRSEERNLYGRFEMKHEQTPIDRRSKEKFLRNDQTISHGYRDAFQVRPNEYEHELADEEYSKPRPRKRRPPQNEEFVLNAKEVAMRNERVKVAAVAPSTRVPLVPNSEAATSKKIEAIKSLIKMQQEEGASLSEILRRKNLTLIDLLKGKEDVISALKMEDIDEIGDDIEQISMAMTSTLAKLPTTEKSSSTTKNMIDTTSVVPIEIDLELSPTMKQATSTTTKESETSQKMYSPGIFIEFDQSDENIKPNLTRAIDEDEIMEFSDFTDYKKVRTTVSPSWISLGTENNIVPPMENMNLNRQEGGSTLSIVRILSPTEITLRDENFEKHRQFDHIHSQNDNSSPSTIDDHLDLSEDDYQYDAPSNDMQPPNEHVPLSMKDEECNDHKDKQENMNVEKTKERSNESDLKNTNDSFSEEMIKTFLENYPNVEDAKSNNERYEDIVSELEPEARAEIFELFSSGSGKKLQRLLESRNMSLEELIALRQRGSSKVHLAEVSRLRNQKALWLPEERQQLTKKQLRDPEEKSILPHFRNETTFIKSPMNETQHDINGTTHFVESSTFVIVTESSPKSTEKDLNIVQEKEPDLYLEVATVSKDTSSEDIQKKHLNEVREDNSNRLIEVTELFTTFKSLPFGKNYDQESWDHIYETLSEKNVDNGPINVVRNDYTKELIGNDLKANVSAIYETSTSNRRDDVETELREKNLSKIKSSIIASGAIIGVTIVVFLAIFVTCRIRHKQKYRYRNSFPRTVFQSPMTTARKLSNTSSLNNIMVNVVATSTTKRLEKNDSQQVNNDYDPKCDIDNDSLDANDSWETIPDYMK